MRIPSRQLRFVHEYAVDGNGAAAAIRAGYAAGSAHVAASRMLRKDNIRAALAAKQAETASRLQITRERVVAELLKAAEMAELKGDPQGIISAYREIGRLLGLYAPETRRVDVSAEGEALVHRLRAMSDGELLALAS